MIYKTICIIATCFVLGSCATNYDPKQDPPFVSQQSVSCPGFNKKYAFDATKAQSGDNLWRRIPMHFLGAIFDSGLSQKITSQATAASMEYDDTQERIRIRLFSNSGEQIYETRYTGKIIDCKKDLTLIHASQVLAGDGARVTRERKITITLLNRTIRVESDIEDRSTFLFFSKTLRRNYMAEFNEAD